MHDRPAKLSPLALLVVWGAKQLTLGEKVVWYRDWCLDRGGLDGSYASAKGVAESLGGSVTPASVDTIRSRLGKLGLQVAFKRVEGRNPGRVCTLPAACTRPRHAREAAQFCALLDAHILQRERGPTLAEISIPIEKSKTVNLNSGLEGKTEGVSGGVGGASLLSDVQTSLSSTVTETKKRSEKRVGSTNQREKRGGEPQPVGDVVLDYLQRFRDTG